jgi:hypothetical protein
MMTSFASENKNNISEHLMVLYSELRVDGFVQ